MTEREAGESLGRVPPASLAGARVTLHWAAQIVSAAGATWVEPRADFSHTALSWIASIRAMASEVLPRGTRALLRLNPGRESLVMDRDVQKSTYQHAGYRVTKEHGNETTESLH